MRAHHYRPDAYPAAVAATLIPGRLVRVYLTLRQFGPVPARDLALLLYPGVEARRPGSYVSVALAKLARLGLAKQSLYDDKWRALNYPALDAYLLGKDHEQPRY